MKKLFENWRKYINEQSDEESDEESDEKFRGFQLPPGSEPDYGSYKPHAVDDHLSDESKYYVREGDNIVYIRNEFSEVEIDLLRNSVEDFMKEYPEPVRSVEGIILNPQKYSSRRRFFLDAIKSKLKRRFDKLDRVPYSPDRRKDMANVAIGELEPEGGGVIPVEISDIQFAALLHRGLKNGDPEVIALLDIDGDGIPDLDPKLAGDVKKAKRLAKARKIKILGYPESQPQIAGDRPSPSAIRK